MSLEIGELLFSRATYQVEVKDKGISYWTFLQFNGLDQRTDAFCSCAMPECEHLAVAEARVRAGGQLLHRQFEKSFWCALGQLCLDLCGNQLAEPCGLVGFDQLLMGRPVETEGSSIKFAQLTQEERQAWKEGRPPAWLRFELSLWADLAKWWFLANGTEVRIGPDWQLEARSGDKRWWVQVPEEQMARLIPTLNTVRCSLRVVGVPDRPQWRYLDGRLEEIVPELPQPGPTARRIGDWYFEPKTGFFPVGHRPRIIQEPDQVSLLLDGALVGDLEIVGARLHHDPRPARYQIALGPDDMLQVLLYLDKPGDLGVGARLVGQWLDNGQRELYRLEGVRWGQIVTRLSADQLQPHLAWLHAQKGWTVHETGIPLSWGYQLDDQGNLHFFWQAEQGEEGAVVDLGHWLYVAGEGLFRREPPVAIRSLSDGLMVPHVQLAHFLKEHRSDLELVPHLFAPESPIRRAGLQARLLDDGRIELVPIVERTAGYEQAQIRQWEELLFVEGVGFRFLPLQLVLPLEYRERTIVAVEQLEELRPYLIDVDHRLLPPKERRVLITQLRPAERGWLARVRLETDLGTVDGMEVWEAARGTKRYFCSDAGRLDLRDSSLEWLTAAQRQDNMFQVTAADLLRWTMMEGVEPLPQDQETRRCLEVATRWEQAELPPLDALHAQLRPYQEEGARWLWFLYRNGLSGLLCDEMGLGKTYQALALMAACSSKPGYFLVVCPQSVIYHWRDAIQSALGLPTYCFGGPRRDLDEFLKSHRILLTSYGMVRQHIDRLKEIPFELAILDEVQVAKNATSLTHRALSRVRASMRLGLTGTPVENRLWELKSLMDLVLPRYLPGPTTFRRLFVTPIEQEKSREARQRLQTVISPFVLRRRKREVLPDLPAKTEELATCSLTEQQAQLYNSWLERARTPLLEALETSDAPLPYTSLLGLLTQLKQICDHPALFLRDTANYEQYACHKWDLFLELLDEARASNQKLVVYSHYLGMLDIIEMHLRRQEIGYAAIRGSTTRREEELRRFQKDPHCTVFVGSLQAIGLGVDLTAASIVIHYDRWWNPAREDQATDRVHRIGQRRGVQVYKLMTLGTIEERIEAILTRKRTLVDEIWSAEGLHWLDRREFIDLLQFVRTDSWLD
jgi:superfamily II DNA or RNA helicase